MESTSLNRLWKQILLITAVLLITTGIALAEDIRYKAVRFRELVIMDPKVFYHERILDKLPKDTRVIFLNGDTTGMDQITKILAREKDIQVLRIFSHGSPGQMVLNGEVIDSRTLAEYRRSLNTWADALTDDADIILYGCNIADTEKGRGFVNELARLTGADVAASTNFTGGPENEWTLEYATGPVEALDMRITGYPCNLACPDGTCTVINKNNSGAGSLRQAIEVTATDGDEIVFNIETDAIIKIETELSIGKSLTINGDNTAGSGTDVTVQVTAPGDSTWRVFNITASGKTVNISNMTVKGGDVGVSSGGGIFIYRGTVNLENAIISGSTANHGGGISNYGTLNMDRCTISDNTANYGGGGIYNDGTITSLTNSTISGNTATGQGGGIYNNGAITSLTNSTISGNTTSFFGGGICNNTTITSLTNSTISDNTAAYDGGGITNYGDLLAIQNTIIANNTSDGSPDDYYYKDGTLTDNGYNVVEHSNKAANATGGFNSPTNILYNTKYNNSTTANTSWNKNAGNLVNTTLDLADGLSYSGGYTETVAVSGGGFLSGLEGAGSASENTDQRGYYRNTSGTRTITRGAYQYDGVVAKIGTGEWTTNTNTFTTIQGAYNALSTDGLTINLVETAIHESGIEFDANRTVTIHGGGAGTTIVQAEDTPGTASDRVFYVTNGTVTLEDMTIRHGNVTGYGGGISNSATLTINNSTISGNTASEYGGGIYNDGSGNVNINSSYLSGNTANGCGGIINYGNMDIVDSTISGNTADYFGGGIYTSGEMTLENSTVSGNTCTGDSGGGISMAGGGTSELTNSTISGNRSTGHGGGIYTSGGTLILSNCTIANNHSDGDNTGGEEGGGIYFYNTTLTASNTILANNYKGSGTGTGDDYYYATGTLIDNGYNVVEYQNFPSLTLSGPKKAFYLASDILYNTQFGNSSKTDFETWTQHTSPTSIQTLNLSSALALNDSTNGTYTLAFTGDSFAAASATTGIPYGSDPYWNNSPATDQRDVSRMANQNTSIGAYSTNYIPPSYYYMAKATGNWSAHGTVWFTNTIGGTVAADYTTQASEAPTADNSAGIIIYDDISVAVDAETLTIDQTTVNSGASLTVAGGKTLTIADGDGTDLTVNGSLTNSGTVNSASDSAIVISGGTLTISDGTVNADGSFDATGGNVTFTDAGDLELGGTVTSLGAFTCGNGTVTYNYGGAQTVAPVTYNHVVFGESGDKTLGGAVAVNGNLTINSDVTLDVSGSNYALNVAGNWTNAGSFTAQTGTVTFNGSDDATLTGSSQNTFHNLIVNKSNSADTKLILSGGADVTVNNDLSLTKGTFDLSSFEHNVAVGHGLSIGTDGRWIKHANQTYYLLFYGDACSVADLSSTAPQNLGHIKVDE